MREEGGRSKDEGGARMRASPERSAERMREELLD
jgi:hypothetical protein